MNKIRSPFDWLSPTEQKVAFILTFLLTMILMVSLNSIDSHLKTAAAPSGIVSFELAGNTASAKRILDSWGAEGKMYAGLSLGLDYLFLVSYALAIALGCVLVSRGLKIIAGTLSSAGSLLAWIVLIAAILDATENYGLIKVLLGSRNDIWPALARWCSLLKFSIVGLGLLYVILGAATIWGAKALRKI